jgi:hypothetical protein
MAFDAEGSAVFDQIIWNDEPGGNIEHIEEHGLTIDDVEHVLANFESESVSCSSDHQRKSARLEKLAD